MPNPHQKNNIVEKLYKCKNVTKLLMEKCSFLTSREIILERSPINKNNVANNCLLKISFICFQLVTYVIRMHSDKLYRKGASILLAWAKNIAHNWSVIVHAYRVKIFKSFHCLSPFYSDFFFLTPLCTVRGLHSHHIMGQHLHITKNI